MFVLSGKIDTDQWIMVKLFDSSSVGQTGKLVGDLTVKYKHESEIAFSTYNPLAGDWRELDVDGVYELNIGASEFTLNGNYIISVECAGCVTFTLIVSIATKYIYETQNDLDTFITSPVDANLTQINGETDNVDNFLASTSVIVNGAVDGVTFTPTTTSFDTDLSGITLNNLYKLRSLYFTSGDLIGQAVSVKSCSLIDTKYRLAVSEMSTIPSDGDTFIIV